MTVHLLGQAADLLELARAVLDEKVAVPARQRARAAAHLGRLALEEIVSRLCARVGAELPRASMRSRLVVLQVLAPPEWSRSACAAWEGLSRACHRHAYELSPADAEIGALLDHVAVLLLPHARKGS
ncbi:hypothetical protein [Pseudonocardia asaccharolytica]|uniref:SAV-6107-like HEPN domain-containing protein n=1 Tax=Pseudonocardia asaccharolytica DSM 44247 = NBRC 16224 TaxID=1123024 RepID=A0A511D1J3_9PSEU|nr:hypothetical protein [Pseudonocardia asaccharolytica]GEL18669.1 hypothetical protein PA7_25060 [Pseudonocardia asaccharolytica DSM 44247 = NBRC 16224]